MRILYAYVLPLVLLSYFQVNAQSIDTVKNSTTTVTAAYSSQLLSNIYSGFCYRVRRASDNAEAWIDFDASTQSVTANSNATIVLPGSSSFAPGTVMRFARFFAGTNCYVTTWFDQSGNGYDAVQTTASAQPRIVNAGVMDVLADHAAVNLMDTNGKVIAAFTITDWKQTVNINSMPAGMHMVQLNNGELQKVTKN
jgi:hypothetical protein